MFHIHIKQVLTEAKTSIHLLSSKPRTLNWLRANTYRWQPYTPMASLEQFHLHHACLWSSCMFSFSTLEAIQSWGEHAKFERGFQPMQTCSHAVP